MKNKTPQSQSKARLKTYFSERQNEKAVIGSSEHLTKIYTLMIQNQSDSPDKETEVIKQLIQEAQLGDIAAFNALTYSLKHKTKNNMPAPLTEWALGIASGEILKPRKPTGPTKNHEAEFAIFWEVYQLKNELQIPATRNDISPNTSACDIVQELLKEIGIHKSYESIKKIYLNQKKSKPNKPLAWE